MNIFTMAAVVTVLSVACGQANSNASASNTLAAATPSMVCLLSAMPSGWVVVGHTTNAGCGEVPFASPDSWNTYVIAQPGIQATVCDDSPIPPGYTNIGATRAIQCEIPSFSSIDYTNAFVIKKS